MFTETEIDDSETSQSLPELFERVIVEHRQQQYKLFIVDWETAMSALFKNWAENPNVLHARS